jgi:hypothetical protein
MSKAEYMKEALQRQAPAFSHGAEALVAGSFARDVALSGARLRPESPVAF